jgi:ADP-ribose pyrophosphatase
LFKPKAYIIFYTLPTNVQYRHGIKETRYEICAGVCETGEEPLLSAQRELYEETGYGNGNWTKLMTISANASTMTNITHCYLVGRSHL